MTRIICFIVGMLLADSALAVDWSRKLVVVDHGLRCHVLSVEPRTFQHGLVPNTKYIWRVAWIDVYADDWGYFDNDGRGHFPNERVENLEP